MKIAFRSNVELNFSLILYFWPINLEWLWRIKTHANNLGLGWSPLRCRNWSSFIIKVELTENEDFQLGVGKQNFRCLGSQSPSITSKWMWIALFRKARQTELLSIFTLFSAHAAILESWANGTSCAISEGAFCCLAQKVSKRNMPLT